MQIIDITTYIPKLNQWDQTKLYKITNLMPNLKQCAGKYFTLK